MALFGNESYIARGETTYSVALGVTDVVLTLRHGSQPTTELLQAFISRFALGFLARECSVADPSVPLRHSSRDIG